ncbi:hypothetical protein ALC62_09602 [Cyphomyrmex costatus]|uniref:Uncharacterized protein n=1 Tax=Cyphomyrmex costatus TaxID=456900 RepID=A0A151IFL1_9HYME|nr:hypothetical protein ALC62_09602 [Cyphomyrmex costatus]
MHAARFTPLNPKSKRRRRSDTLLHKGRWSKGETGGCSRETVVEKEEEEEEEEEDALGFPETAGENGGKLVMPVELRPEGLMGYADGLREKEGEKKQRVGESLRSEIKVARPLDIQSRPNVEIKTDSRTSLKVLSRSAGVLSNEPSLGRRTLPAAGPFSTEFVQVYKFWCYYWVLKSFRENFLYAEVNTFSPLSFSHFLTLSLSFSFSLPSRAPVFVYLVNAPPRPIEVQRASWRGRDHPPPPLEATKASRGPAASSSQRRWSRRPFAAGWGQEEGYSWTWSGQRNNAGVPTETHPAFPTTGSSGKRALASGRRSSEFSQVSRLARTFSPTKTIAEGSTPERRECVGACRREFKGPSTG